VGSGEGHFLPSTNQIVIESIGSSVTTMQDELLHFFCTPEGLVGAAKAYRDAGLRAFITVTLWDWPLADSPPCGRELIHIGRQKR
jgi:5-methylthioadenosine/S-adenosylhomocysteine deaminase